MGPQGFTGQPRAVRELEVVDLRYYHFNGQTVHETEDDRVRQHAHQAPAFQVADRELEEAR